MSAEIFTGAESFRSLEVARRRLADAKPVPVPWLLPEVTRPAVRVHELQPVVLAKFTHRSTDPLPIRQLSNAAVPWSGEASLCVQQGYR